LILTYDFNTFRTGSCAGGYDPELEANCFSERTSKKEIKHTRKHPKQDKKLEKNIEHSIALSSDHDSFCRKKVWTF